MCKEKIFAIFIVRIGFYDTQKNQYYFIDTKGQTLMSEINSLKLMDGFGIDIYQDLMMVWYL